MICPKCKQDSVSKSETFTEMLLCKNKHCEWYIKEDIRKLQGLNIEKFKFTYPNFEKSYEEIMTKYESKFYNRENRYTFLKDFLQKHKNELYIIISKDTESKKELKENLKKDSAFINNIEEILSYSEFTRFQRKDNHIIFYEILDLKQINNLKSLVKYCKTYYFFN
jgi:hypothetical protein